METVIRALEQPLPEKVVLQAQLLLEAAKKREAHCLKQVYAVYLAGLQMGQWGRQTIFIYGANGWQEIHLLPKHHLSFFQRAFRGTERGAIPEIRFDDLSKTRASFFALMKMCDPQISKYKTDEAVREFMRAHPQRLGPSCTELTKLGKELTGQKLPHLCRIFLHLPQEERPRLSSNLEGCPSLSYCAEGDAYLLRPPAIAAAKVVGLPLLGVTGARLLFQNEQPWINLDYVVKIPPEEALSYQFFINGEVAAETLMEVDLYRLTYETGRRLTKKYQGWPPKMLAVEVQEQKTKYGPRLSFLLRAGDEKISWEKFLTEEGFIQQKTRWSRIHQFAPGEQEILNPVLIAGMTPCGLCTKLLTDEGLPFYSLEGFGSETLLFRFFCLSGSQDLLIRKPLIKRIIFS